MIIYAADAPLVPHLEAETLRPKVSSSPPFDGNVFVNGAQVILADVEASNGIIHVIDSVLLPPVEEDPMTIVDVAVDNGSFETLVAALTEAELVSS